METQIKTMVKNKSAEKIRKEIAEHKKEVSNTQKKISRINKQIQDSTGKEQEILHGEILELKTSIMRLMAQSEQKEKEEELLYERFQKLYADRNNLQDFQIMARGKICRLNNELKTIFKK